MGWHKPESAVTSDINVTPLVDVMLVLLIIFMVITPLLQHGIPVSLAPTVNPKILPDADKDDAIIVSVSHDGRLYLANDMLDPATITDKVRDLLTDRLDKTVFVKADSLAHFSAVTSVVDAVRDAGVDQIAMLTERVDVAGNPIGGIGGAH